MALIKCPDCGKMFSEYAECCPDCGCPTKDAKAANIVNDSPIPQPTEEVGSNEQALSIIDEKSVEGKAEIQQDLQPSTEEDESIVEEKNPNRKWLWGVGIMTVLIVVGFFIIVYNSFDPQKDDKEVESDSTVEVVTRNIEYYPENKGNSFSEPRTYYHEDIWVEEIDDGDGNPYKFEASNSATIKFTTQHTVRIEVEQQETFGWEGTYSIEGQTITMSLQDFLLYDDYTMSWQNVVDDSKRIEVVTATLKGNKLIIGENHLNLPRELERKDVVETTSE